MRAVATFFIAVALLWPASSRADEGMWTFNDFPAETVQARYGFRPTQQWLDKLRLSSVRLAGGCSGAFVSPDGLVVTNHHCVHACVEQLSTAKSDYVAEGFYAKERAGEQRCSEIELNQLVRITDVTARLSEATKGKSGAEFAAALRAAQATLETECAKGDPLVRCDVVSLYRGGRYDLYEYRRFQDVRLVFAPELEIAAFGGDPYNFNFPRYSLDMAFLRVYGQDGKPLSSKKHYLPFGKPSAEGELIFIPGHPGTTARAMTIAQLEFERDLRLPQQLIWASELRGILLRMQSESPELRRLAAKPLANIENGIKARRGRLMALGSPEFFEALREREAQFRAKVAANPALQEAYAGAWEAMERAMARYRQLWLDYTLLEEARGFQSELFGYARMLTRAAEELAKPNAERLQEYGEARLPALKQKLASTAPIHDEIEIATLTHSLEKLRESLGADSPLVVKVFGKRSARERALELVRGSSLGDAAKRQALFEGGAAALAASTDPMLLLARAVDSEARAIRKTFESEAQAPVTQAGEQLAKARFGAFGTSEYPDATFTLRLAFGKVEGWAEGGLQIGPYTEIGTVFERATGSEPFVLPKRWLAAKERLALSTHFDLTTTADTIGGNSGSPVVNAKGEVVGLNFDRNLPGLSGDFAYDAAKKRSVGVDVAAMVEALEKVYQAERLVKELRPARR